MNKVRFLQVRYHSNSHDTGDEIFKKVFCKLHFRGQYEDIIKIFQDNDAVMAANLDGGNSSAMIYDGSYVNTPVSMYGSRNLPTVFLVKGDN